MSRLWWEVLWQVRLLCYTVFAASPAPRRVVPHRSASPRRHGR